MCRDCWEEFGSSQIDNPKVRKAAEAIGEVYKYSPVGGNLHVAIDDWNLDDLSFVREAIGENIHEMDADGLLAECDCLDLLDGLTEEERESALALHCGFWKPGE